MPTGAADVCHREEREAIGERSNRRVGPGTDEWQMRNHGDALTRLTATTEGLDGLLSWMIGRADEVEAMSRQR